MDERLFPSRENGYVLSPELLKAYTRELLEQRPPVGNDVEVCYRLEGDDPFADIARTIECQIFEPAFGNTPEIMQKEYGEYEQQSTFLLVVDKETQEPTGALRTIRNGPQGLKSINDLVDYFVNQEGMLESETEGFVRDMMSFHGIESLDDCLDVGTAVVLPDHRLSHGKLTTPKIYRGMYADAMTGKAKHLISMIDAKAHQNLTNLLGIPFMPLAGIGPIENYIGSKKTFPVYGVAEEFAKSVDRKRIEALGKYASHPAYAAFLKKVFGVLVGDADESLQFTINKEALKLK